LRRRHHSPHAISIAFEMLNVLPVGVGQNVVLESR